MNVRRFGLNPVVSYFFLWLVVLASMVYFQAFFIAKWQFEFLKIDIASLGIFYIALFLPFIWALPLVLFTCFLFQACSIVPPGAEVMFGMLVVVGAQFYSKFVVVQKKGNQIIFVWLGLFLRDAILYTIFTKKGVVVDLWTVVKVSFIPGFLSGFLWIPFSACLYWIDHLILLRPRFVDA